MEQDGHDVDQGPGTVKSRCAGGRARVLPLLGRIKAERGS